MKPKFLKVIAILLLSVIILPACGGKGLEIGFGGRGEFLDNIMGAVKSDKTDFDVDNVTLDFYYGGILEEYGEDDERQIFGVALYWGNRIIASEIDFDTPYEDYRTLEDLYFVKFISAEQWLSGGYGVEATVSKKSFEHNETLTVPAEMFLQDEKNLVLSFIQIYTVTEQPYYYIVNGGYNYLKIKYEFLDEQTVRLSKP